MESKERFSSSVRVNSRPRSHIRLCQKGRNQQVGTGSPSSIMLILVPAGHGEMHGENSDKPLLSSAPDLF